MTTIFFGQWDLFDRWKSSIRSGRYMGDLNRDLALFGDEVKAKVVGHIDRQDLPWPALADATIRKKGFDQIYVETGDYMRSIQRTVEPRKNGATLKVHVTGTHQGSGLNMAALGTMLEYGTSTIPARPLWGPVLHEIMTDPNFKDVLDLSKMFGFR